MTPGGIEIQIDCEVDAAYVRLSLNAVVRMSEVTDEVVVDLEEMNAAVGIEVLRLDATIPYDRLCTEYHIHSDVIDLLRQIRPSVAGFMSITSAPDGTSHASAAPTLTSV